MEKKIITCDVEYEGSQLKCDYFCETLGLPVCIFKDKCNRQNGSELHMYKQYEPTSNKIINEVLGIKSEEVVDDNNQLDIKDAF